MLNKDNEGTDILYYFTLLYVVEPLCKDTFQAHSQNRQERLLPS